MDDIFDEVQSGTPEIITDNDEDVKTIDLNEPSSQEQVHISNIADDQSLKVDISDALNEKNRVKFTINTNTKLREFKAPSFTVTRYHDDFVWLRDRFAENAQFAGFIIPPPPPQPDFSIPHLKLSKLCSEEQSMTKKEFQTAKADLENEYLALFKKSVNIHEVFLQRIASHEQFRFDTNFKVFLEYENDLMAKGRSFGEKFTARLSKITKSADEKLFQNQREPDEFFEEQKEFLTNYNRAIRDAAGKASKFCINQDIVSDQYLHLKSGFLALSGSSTNSAFGSYVHRMSDIFEKLQKPEKRYSSDIDLKLADILQYFNRESRAALDLLYRRSRSFADLDQANRTVERSRMKGKDVEITEKQRDNKKSIFESISTTSKIELEQFKENRVNMVKQNLVELSQLMSKQTASEIKILEKLVEGLEENRSMVVKNVAIDYIPPNLKQEV
ncbi:hypothetical protein SNEBB_005861 [Seison nebaliae]|nr:hypothetical protein SNEBB_005861 [Seison nebaliae]